MTHPYELKIQTFMKQVGKAPLEMEEKLLKPATKDVEHFLKKMFEDDPNRPFSIRMSNIGRPLCQLQMDKAKANKVDNDWNYPLRMMYGSIVEGLTVSILKHSGINVEEEQTAVKLAIAGITINGTLDLVIDGKVWDIKSASQYAYKEKFASYESLRDSDDFGYLPQLYGYAKARGCAAGGWIVVDKSSGDIKIVAVPDSWQSEQQEALQLIERNVKALTGDIQFRRCFEDKSETFNRKFTGNRVLAIQCTYCPFRYSCWEGLKHLPSASSKAFDRPYKYYTEYNEVI